MRGHNHSTTRLVFTGLALTGLLTTAGLFFGGPAGLAATPRAGNQCKKRDVGKTVGQLTCTKVSATKFVWQRATSPAAPAGGCDPNYTPCVPIASDVDCAAGSGNGPAYVQGRVTVIGEDIYGLDADNDGIGCEKN